MVLFENQRDANSGESCLEERTSSLKKLTLFDKRSTFVSKVLKVIITRAI